MKIQPTHITEVQKEEIHSIVGDMPPAQLGKLISLIINIKRYKGLITVSQLTFRDARKLINELHRTPNGAHKSL